MPSGEEGLLLRGGWGKKNCVYGKKIRETSFGGETMLGRASYAGEEEESYYGQRRKGLISPLLPQLTKGESPGPCEYLYHKTPFDLSYRRETKIATRIVTKRARRSG